MAGIQYILEGIGADEVDLKTCQLAADIGRCATERVEEAARIMAEAWYDKIVDKDGNAMDKAFATEVGLTKKSKSSPEP